jgi:iron complex transport system substrate-binding protein
MYPQRIVCLAAETPEILHRLNALDRVVGISAYTKRPEQALQIPKISGFKYGNEKRIKEVNPDLAILTSGVQKELATKLADTGINTLHLQPHRLQDLFKSITLVGNVVGKPREAENLNAELFREMEDIRLQAATLPWNPRVYFEEWMDPLICGTAWVSDIIEMAGGRDVFRSISVEGRNAQQRIIQTRDVIDAAPDMVLASWCGKPFNKKDFISRDGYMEIPAVFRDAVYEVDGSILQVGPMLIESLKEVFKLIKNFVERYPR